MFGIITCNVQLLCKWYLLYIYLIHGMATFKIIPEDASGYVTLCVTKIWPLFKDKCRKLMSLSICIVASNGCDTGGVFFFAWPLLRTPPPLLFYFTSLSGITIIKIFQFHDYRSKMVSVDTLSGCFPWFGIPGKFKRDVLSATSLRGCFPWFGMPGKFKRDVVSVTSLSRILWVAGKQYVSEKNA
jgi:hypothetical protein